MNYQTLNNWNLQISSDFCNLRGHDVEDKYKEAFPCLKRFHQEDKLKIAVIQNVFNDFPNFIPEDLSAIFSKIQ